MDMRPIRQSVSREEWQQRVQDCRNSGLPVRTWCQMHEVSEGSYYYWLKQLRHEILIEAPAKERLLPSFCAVTVEDQPETQALILHLPKLQLEVKPGVSQAAIQAAIYMLKSVC